MHAKQINASFEQEEHPCARHLVHDPFDNDTYPD
jgi:hypothetical protein